MLLPNTETLFVRIATIVGVVISAKNVFIESDCIAFVLQDADAENFYENYYESVQGIVDVDVFEGIKPSIFVFIPLKNIVFISIA